MQATNKSHAELAERFNQDETRVNWHDETLWWIRQKRDKAAWQMPEWEWLRETPGAVQVAAGTGCSPARPRHPIVKYYRVNPVSLSDREGTRGPA